MNRRETSIPYTTIFSKFIGILSDLITEELFLSVIRKIVDFGLRWTVGSVNGLSGTTIILIVVPQVPDPSVNFTGTFYTTFLTEFGNRDHEQETGTRDYMSCTILYRTYKYYTGLLRFHEFRDCNKSNL